MNPRSNRPLRAAFRRVKCPARLVKCPAKINLGLQVLGRRPDGYHELRTVFQTIALHDELHLQEKAARTAKVELSGDGAEAIGLPNLAVLAAEAVLEELGERRTVRLTLNKKIPPGSGLGGGSSDAAAVLRVLPVLLGRPLAPERRLALAAELGADVPFFLVGGQAIGLGRGTEVYPLPDVPALPLVVVHPGLHVSSADAYRQLDQARDNPEPLDPAALTSTATEPSIVSFCAIVCGRRWDRLRNDFEPVVFSTYPELARLKTALTRAGASAAMLSGSGSAVFGVFDSGTAARHAAARLRRRWPRWQIWVTRTVSRLELAREWVGYGQ